MNIFQQKLNFLYGFAIFIFVKPSETASKKYHPVDAKKNVSLLFVLSVATINHLVDLRKIVHIPEK